MRLRFDQELKRLQKSLVELGIECENAISTCFLGLLPDHDASNVRIEVSEMWASINEKQNEIESLCLKLLLQQQPVAKDLRVITSTLKMVTDMKRIGVQALDIAEIIEKSQLGGAAESAALAHMAQASSHMLKGCVSAFSDRKISAAQTAIAYDDVVDNYFKQVRQMLRHKLETEGEDSDQALDLLLVAKYFERIGDHSVNIAKWIIYLLTDEAPASNS